MSIKSTVIAEIQQIAGDHEITLPTLTDDSVFEALGLHSLEMAILVARLEDALGRDPFAERDDFPHIVTLGDFVRLYECCPAQR